MMFKDLVGQKQVIESLLTSIKRQKIPHAQLFTAREGAGGLALAMAFAQYLHCTAPTDTDVCGVCPSCVKYRKFEHPDLHFVFPFKKKAKVRETCDDLLAEFRLFLQKEPYGNLSLWLDSLNETDGKGMIYTSEGDTIIRKLAYKPYESDRKIMVVWLPELMNQECANKILKILEEPPTGTYFLLVSENPDLLLATILSRTQRVGLMPLSVDEIAEKMTIENICLPDQARTFAALSGGSYLKARQAAMEDDVSRKNLDLFIQIMRQAYTVGNLNSASNPLLKFDALKTMYDFVDELCRLGKDTQRQYLETSQRLIRENYIANLNQTELNYMTPPEKEFSDKFARFITDKNIEKFYEEFELAQNQLVQNINPKFVFTDLMLQMIVLLKQS